MAQVTQDPAGKEDAKTIKNSKVESIYPEKDDSSKVEKKVVKK